jgi:hypothetical protein
MTELQREEYRWEAGITADERPYCGTLFVDCFLRDDRAAEGGVQVGDGTDVGRGK